MPKTRSGFTLLKAPETKGADKKDGPPPFEAPNKSLPYWLGKGCTVIKDDEADEFEDVGGTDLSKLGRDELNALAASRGLDPADFKTKGELVSALES